MDARGDLALRLSGGLERLSVGSGWRDYLYTFTSPAPAGSRLAAHARPGPADDSDILERGGLAQLLHTWPGAAGVVTTHLHPTRVGRIAARGSRPARSRPPPRCSALVPELQTVCCRAASDPSSLPSLTGLWGRRRAVHSITVTGRGVDCAGVLPPVRLPFRHSPGRGVGSPTSVATAGASCPVPLSPCPPSGPADVVVTPTRMRTSRTDGR